MRQVNLAFIACLSHGPSSDFGLAQVRDLQLAAPPSYALYLVEWRGLWGLCNSLVEQNLAWAFLWRL